jgi:hypothetical protein
MLTKALVWTVPIEMVLILTQHAAGLAFVADQDPVGALGPDTADEPLGVRVGLRSQLRRMRMIGTDGSG